MSAQPPISDRDLAEVAALADGSLTGADRDAAAARVTASPLLAAELERQMRALRALAAAQAEVSAPASLRARVEARHERRPARRRLRWRVALPVGGVLATALVAAAVLLLAPSDLSGARFAAEAAATHARAPQGSAPATRTPTELDFERFGVTFPAWEREFEWKAIGQRSDRVGDHDLATVLYRKGDKTIGYSVASGDEVSPPGDARPVSVGGTSLQVWHDGDRTVVLFERLGHTCVLSGVGVPEQTLTKLAAWKGAGTVAF